MTFNEMLHALQEDTHDAPSIQETQEEFEKLLQPITIQAVAGECEEPSEAGGSLFSDYEVRVVIGPRETTVGGWVVCGWLAENASVGLDGCGRTYGLTAGWQQGNSDSGTGGLPIATAKGMRIQIRGGEGRFPGEIWLPDVVPMDASIVGIADDVLEVPEWFLRRINEAIEGVVPEVKEPTAEEIWENLNGASGTMEIGDNMRIGCFEGIPDYAFVVIETAGSYEAFRPDQTWEEAVSERVCRDVQGRLDRFSKEKDA